MAQQKKADIENTIISCGADEFLEHGFKDASIRRIAGKAGISKSNIYTYVKSKDELFSLIVNPTISEVDRILSMMEHPDQMEEESYTFDYHLKIIDYMAEFIDRHRTNLQLIIFHSQGSSYESFYEKAVGRYTALNIRAIPYYAEKMNFKNRNVSKFFIHTAVSSYATFIREIVMHNIEKNDIIRYGREFMTYAYFGQQALFDWDKNYK